MLALAGIGIVELAMYGEAAIKLGATGWKAYCELNADNVEAFTAEKMQSILDEYKTTDDVLREHGLDPADFAKEE